MTEDTIAVNGGSYKKLHAVVTIDGVEWKKTSRRLFGYTERGRFVLKNKGGIPHFKGDIALAANWIDHTWLDHGEVFKNSNGELAVASHIYDVLYSPHHPSTTDKEGEEKIREIKEYANKHNLVVKIEPIESWYYPKNATLLWWTTS